jgi:hypothetical protein
MPCSNVSCGSSSNVFGSSTTQSASNIDSHIVGPYSRMLYTKNKATQLLMIRYICPLKHYFP